MKQGTKVLVTRATLIGTEEILGIVTMGLIEEIEGKETMTHITVEGMVIATMIHGLPLPIEEERSVTLTMIPVESTKWTKVEIIV